MSVTSASAGAITCSVCIANFNGLDLINACIASVKSQDCGFPIEIIVHDDASTDGSAAAIAANHPDVRLIESRQNAGFCVANNRMAAAARGEYLLLLNNDAALMPGALAALMQEAVRLQRPAILTLPQYDAESGELLDIGSLLDFFFNAVPNRDPLRNDVGMVAGACLWMPRSLWNELGGFPEWFGSIGEDLFLCCAARLAGHPVRALGVSGYRHGVGMSFGGGKVRDDRLRSTFRRRALSERNRTCVMAMTCPWPVLLALLPAHLVILLLEGALLSLLRLDRRYLSDIYLPALLAPFSRIGPLRETRRAIMRRRRVATADFFSAFVPVPHKLRMLLRHGLPKLS